MFSYLTLSIHSSKMLHCCYRMSQMKHSTSSLRFLRTETVSFTSGKGVPVTMEAVVQDTIPDGSHKGTIVALHGAPGSHNDFKYVLPHAAAKGIRVIGVNFPGMGFTPNQPDLIYTNEERNNYVRALMDSLGLKENVVMLGHSRGAENAMQIAVSEETRCRGVVLANPTGLRPHRTFPGARMVRGFRKLYDTFSFMRSFWHMFMGFVYNRMLGMRVPNGECACVAFRALEYLEFGKHLRWIDKWNDQGKRRGLVMAYGGSDWMIEKEVSEELSRSFGDIDRLDVEAKDAEAEGKAAKWINEEMNRGGRKNLVVCFKEDGHFLQRDKAMFLAEAATALLSTNNNQ